VEARNNVFYKGGDAPIVIVSGPGTVNLSHNWLSEGWKYDFVPEESTAVITEDGTNIAGTDPGFVNPDLGAPEGVAMDPSNTVTLGVKYGSDELVIDNEGLARAGRKQNIIMEAPVADVQGRTIMSAKKLVESLGGVYYWVDADNRMDIVLGLNKISLWIGKPEAQVNGSMVKIDAANQSVVPSVTDTGTVMAPVRFVAEAMGAVVTWDQDNRSIVIERDMGRKYRLVDGSALINEGENPDNDILSAENFNYQYVKHQSGEARAKSTFKDIGAYGFEK
jgi:hypothetical protein